MCDTKKQPWDEEKIRPVKDWSMPEAFDDAKKRNPDLRPYARLVQHQLDDVHESEAYTRDPYTDLTREKRTPAQIINFRDNLNYIDNWTQYEVLELLIQQVNLAIVTTDWLKQFREDLDLKV